ncbi:hypothetical protein BBI01_03065 [Chryseobacterium artocarpi]|uniref:Uncharacterized protein n=1 Tax=Chryseobacterium artocarpi TaxID=1414727 RepID=A0A1B9A0S3_9FLAO|nr:hypothetical protein [Chryseobacterium artocarpi]OCA77450.1 hypothetical protein BBI01_03065 [Chryseobacterium artocarpi]
MIKYLWIVVTLGMLSCIKDRTIKKDSSKDSVPLMGRNISNVEIENNDSLSENELEGEDEFISEKLFQKWKGSYYIENSDIIDGWGRESIHYAELDIIQPDSCVFKSWLADNNGNRYNKNDNYQEYIGGILATTHKDSIEFFTKRIVEGGNEGLSPLLTLIKRKNEYFIYSFLTSPPHNGIMEMPIQKIK